MKFGLDIPNFGLFADPNLLVELAQDAEKAEWDGFFIWDHIARSTAHDVVDPWIALAAIAAKTEKIRIGTMVTPLPRRRPWKVAREAVSLDHLSHGRFILSVGLGAESGQEVEFANFGEELNQKRRAKMLDDALDIVNGLWKGIPYSSNQTSYYKVQNAIFTPRPVQTPRIPIWVAADYPYLAPLRRAAHWDGVCSLITRAMVNPSQNMQSLKTVRETQASALQSMKEVISYIKDQEYFHEHESFDFAYLTPPVSQFGEAFLDIAKPFEELGVTWWIEKLDPPYFGTDWNGQWNLAAMRDHILSGVSYP